MFKNKSILIFILLVGLIAISCVNAEEISNETGDLTIEEINEEITFDKSSEFLDDCYIHDESEKNIDSIDVNSDNNVLSINDGDSVYKDDLNTTNNKEWFVGEVHSLNNKSIYYDNSYIYIPVGNTYELLNRPSLHEISSVYYVRDAYYDYNNSIPIHYLMENISYVQCWNNLIFSFFQDKKNNAMIGVRLISDVEGRISLSDSSANIIETYDFHNSKGEIFYFEASKLKLGDYKLNIYRILGKQFNQPMEVSIGWVTFKVSLDMNINVSDVDKYYHGTERLIVKCTRKTDGEPITNTNISISINGVNYNKVTNSNGIVSLALGLNEGNYTVITNYDALFTKSFVRIKPTIIANDFSKIYKNTTQYWGTFVDSQGKPLKNTEVTFNINGVMYTRKTNDNGVACMNINLNPGKYVLTATNPSNGEHHATTITVLPNIVENKDLTKYYKNKSQYIVRLLDDKGKPVGKGVDVTFNINGVFYTRSTNENGYAKLNINLGAGEYVITADYKGYRESNKIKVLPILSANDLIMNYRDGSQFKVKLVDGQGKAYANQKVTFNINGVFYTRNTNGDGVAKLNIKLMPNEYIITSSFNGFNIANVVQVNEAIPSDDGGSNSDSGSNTNSGGGSNNGYVPYDLDKAIIFNINSYNDRPVKYLNNYRIEVGVYANSYQTGSFVQLFDKSINKNGAYVIADFSSYTSSFYSNMTGVWEWTEWMDGKISEGTHRYSFQGVNFKITKVAVKIMNNAHNSSGYVPYDLDKAIILDIDAYNKYITKNYSHYQVKTYVYQNSNTGIDISLSNNLKSGTGTYSLIDKNYYASSIYSNRTGTWEWSEWDIGYGVSGSTFHRYDYFANNFKVTKVAVKIIDGLSDDGYSFLPTSKHSPNVDRYGVTREYAIANNWHYIEMSVDGDHPGEYVYMGGYVPYDPVAGRWH